MNAENTEKLLKNFPKIYPELHPLHKSPFTSEHYPFSFDCGDGWFQIIWELSEKINKEIKQQPGAERWQPIAVQVKEKFGTLRFYIEKATPGIQAAISEAREKSGFTCELCGRPGILYPNDRDMTLCTEHAAQEPGKRRKNPEK